MSPFIPDVFTIQSPAQFEAVALDIFQYQAAHVPLYEQFLKTLNVQSSKVTALTDIPFLPIQFFRNHTIISNQKTTEIVFSSSGTTGAKTSSHHVAETAIYKKSFRQCFTQFYGPPSNYCVLALLPNYLQREGSSLVYMAHDLISQSRHPLSGFYLNNYEALAQQLQFLRAQQQPTLLLGVTYALLDLAEQFPIHFPELTVMETGGMKGERKEIVREQVHNILRNAFGVNHIHSEYGMTELLSQAYSKRDGLYKTPPWMKILIREINDPYHYLNANETGGINVIDLANIYSCSFIATQDLGKLHTNGSFEVLGRFDNSDLRGCNLMVE